MSKPVRFRSRGVWSAECDDWGDGQQTRCGANVHSSSDAAAHSLLRGHLPSFEILGGNILSEGKTQQRAQRQCIETAQSIDPCHPSPSESQSARIRRIYLAVACVWRANPPIEELHCVGYCKFAKSARGRSFQKSRLCALSRSVFLLYK